MTPKWLHILQHSLGLDQYGQPRKGDGRAWMMIIPAAFAITTSSAPESPDFYQAASLLRPGLDDGSWSAGMLWRHAAPSVVTQAGYDAVKQHSPRPRLTKAQRRWRYFRDACARSLLV